MILRKIYEFYTNFKNLVLNPKTDKNWSIIH